jgi:hypothetical protein
LQELANLKAETAALKAQDRAAAEALVEDSGDIQFSGLVVSSLRCKIYLLCWVERRGGTVALTKKKSLYHEFSS